MSQEKEPRTTTRELSRRAGITYEQGQRFVQAIVAELELGREVHLTGLGILRVHEGKPRKFDTPMVPGGVAKIPPSRCVKFRQSKLMKPRLNGGRRSAKRVRDTAE